MNTKHSFSHGIFKTSQDFKVLWDLIQRGHRIPAWIVYTDEYESPIWDLVEVKARPDGSYMIGSRGISYEAQSGEQGFISACMAISLHFVYV